MNSETWIEKAQRLQGALTRGEKSSAFDGDEAAARERVEIALWLRREFSDEPPAESDVVVPFVAIE
jgi:hypothetical protein